MNIKPRAIVLIPGYMLDETLWCEFEKYLPPEIVIYHAPIAGGKTIRDITQHIIALLPEKFTVIGFSLGGYIARQLAADFPDRIESLVLVASSDDAIRTLGESEELAKAIPGARLETMNGCGHMLPLEQPKTLSTYITAWLATIN